ncbi:hypothetical protein ACFYXP_33055 [Streptomyces sp. NPDC002466]
MVSGLRTFRAVAIAFDERGHVHLGTVTAAAAAAAAAAALVIRLRP